MTKRATQRTAKSGSVDQITGDTAVSSVKLKDGTAFKKSSMSVVIDHGAYKITYEALNEQLRLGRRAIPGKSGTASKKSALTS
jgi:hypothetical protein